MEMGWANLQISQWIWLISYGRNMLMTMTMRSIIDMNIGMTLFMYGHIGLLMTGTS